jgi:hypothetical protein
MRQAMSIASSKARSTEPRLGDSRWPAPAGGNAVDTPAIVLAVLPFSERNTWRDTSISY